MNCARTLTLLDDSLAGELPAATGAELQSHLGRCAGCRAALEELKLLRRELRKLPAPPAHPEMLERMLKTATQPSLAPAVRWRAAPMWRVGLATAAVLLVGFGFVLGRHFAARPGPLSELVAVARPVTVGPAVTDVTLEFRVSDPVPGAEISLTLPKDVQIAGRPNVRQLVWPADLKSGANLLELPLQATGTRNGILVVRLSEGALVRTLKIPVTISGAPDSGATGIRQSATAVLG